MIKKQRGTSDILPSEMLLWQYIEKTMRDEAALYGFEETRFPTFEATELFSRGVGGTTDIVQKEMYTFEDKNGTSLSLRPEGTACVARSVMENGLLGGAMPLKMYYLTNFFRYEKPQAGRSREFFQFGTEMYGSDLPSGDATVISLANGVLKKLGLKNYKLHINSIGCPSCRPAFRQALVEYFKQYESELCPTCKARLETNPLRILDCKSPICSGIAKKAPKTTDHLCDECTDKFESLQQYLKAGNIDFVVDSAIVRGLDYYTGAVFEFISENIGAQSTICGGGRYNGLVAELGGQPTPAVGFGMGITRVILAMEQEGASPTFNRGADIYIAPLDKNAAFVAFGLAHDLREKGLYAETDLVGRSLKAQMKYADKQGAKYVLVIGSEEAEKGVATLKSMCGGENKDVSLSADDIYSAIKE